MAEAPLHCNVQSCRKTLEDNALVTSCSHIFCQQHGQIAIKSNKCLACSTQFRNRFDYNQMDLQPPDQYKAMIITGMNPDQILEIAGRSISFYTYQLSNECRLKDAILKQTKEEMENMKHFCGTMKANMKAELESAHRTAMALKKQLNDKNEELERCREQLNHYSRLNKKLQMDLSACKRQMMTVKLQQIPNTDERTPSVSRLGLNSGSSGGISNENDITFLPQDDNHSNSPNYTPRWRALPRFPE